jgi:hypothetical protein
VRLWPEHALPAKGRQQLGGGVRSVCANSSYQIKLLELGEERRVGYRALRRHLIGSALPASLGVDRTENT